MILNMQQLTRALGATLLLMPILLVGVSPSAAAASPGPAIIYPIAGQTIDQKNDLNIRVGAVDNAAGYLYGLFQNGTMVWENLRDTGSLSGSEITINAGTPAHATLQSGSVQIWVRASVGGEWTDASIIDIALTSSDAGPLLDANQLLRIKALAECFPAYFKNLELVNPVSWPIFLSIVGPLCLPVVVNIYADLKVLTDCSKQYDLPQCLGVRP